MDYRERVIRSVQHKDVDTLPFRHSYGLMPGVLDDWHAQGLPASIKTHVDVCRYFDFPTKGNPLPVNALFDPPFEEIVIEDTPESRIVIDALGRRTRVLREYASLPQAEEYPIKDRATWLDYKRRMQFSPSRIGDDLERNCAQNVAEGKLNTFGAMGFYWFPRDLMGDEHLCIAYYEAPELIEEMLDTWCTLLEQLLSSILQRVSLDQINFGEDMAYRNGSMIGPETFGRFIKPYYDRIYRLVEKYKVPIFSVDTDGRTDQLLEWFGDCGVNLMGPNEVMAGNDITQYRKAFGKTMAYDGGLNKLALPQGPDAIESMLQQTIPPMMEAGSGWIACLDHRVIRGTSLADFRYYVDLVRTLAK